MIFKVMIGKSGCLMWANDVEHAKRMAERRAKNWNAISVSDVVPEISEMKPDDYLKRDGINEIVERALLDAISDRHEEAERQKAEQRIKTLDDLPEEDFAGRIKNMRLLESKLATLTGYLEGVPVIIIRVPSGYLYFFENGDKCFFVPDQTNRKEY